MPKRAKIKWKKVDDSYLADLPGGGNAYVGSAFRDPRWWTNVLYQPVGRDGCCYSGGGKFSTAKQAMRSLEQRV